MQDTGHHDRRMERRVDESFEFRAAFEREKAAMHQWLDCSMAWETVDVTESPAEALAAEFERHTD